jgi:hypothetical protein
MTADILVPLLILGVGAVCVLEWRHNRRIDEEVAAYWRDQVAALNDDAPDGGQ